MLEKLKGHFCTITRHKLMVMRMCFRAGIYKQGLLHDLSKYNPVEFLPGVKYYQGNRSPINAEKEKNTVSPAWLHHKGRNRHHFEYWTDYDPQTKLMSPVKMPVRYVKEMFCDRVAASKIYAGKNYHDGYALDYYLKAKARRKIHPDTSELIERLLRMLAEKGEKETFKYIRSLKKY